MDRYADPTRCPGCAAPLTPGAEACPRCRLVLRGPLAGELYATLTHADRLLDQLRRESWAEPANEAEDAEAADALAPGGVDVATRPELPPGSPSQPRRTGLSSSSVPKILLTLGAVCLVAAALVFLVVTWSVLGVAGRTVTLVALTLTTGVLARLLAGRGLRAATESLGAVTVGLAVLDLLGARNAGWLGDPSSATFAILAGVLLLALGLAGTGLASRTPVGVFVVGELLAGAGLLTVAVGMLDGAWGSTAARAAVATLLAGAVAAALRWVSRGRAPLFSVAAVSCLLAFTLTWVVLVAIGLSRLSGTPTMRSSWVELGVWPLVLAAGYAAVVAALPEVPRPARVLALALALVPFTAALLGPVVDETPTARTVALAAALLVCSGWMWLVPRPWAGSALGVAGVAAIFLLVVVLALVPLALARYAATSAQAWEGSPGGTIPDVAGGTGSTLELAPWLLPLSVLALLVASAAWWPLVAAGRVLGRRAVASAAVLVTLAGWLSLLLWAVPVWTVVATACGVGAAMTVTALVRSSATYAAAGASALALSVPLSFFDETLTLGALGAGALAALALHLSSETRVVAATGGTLVPPLWAGVVWTAGELGGLEKTLSAVAVLALLGALALAWTEVTPALPEGTSTTLRLDAVQVGAALAAVPSGVLGVASAPASQAASWTAVYLTLAGVVAAASSLLWPHRPWTAWLGGTLLALASWVRLADLGVEQPEPYTLPSAAVLLAVGLHRLREDERVSTVRALGAGLALALVPSALWALDEPLSLRALLVGIACVSAVVVGVWARWGAPLVLGSALLAALVIREAAPWVDAAVPRWALIAATGILLIAMGVTWEQRSRDARRVATYVRNLR